MTEKALILLATTELKTCFKPADKSIGKGVVLTATAIFLSIFGPRAILGRG